MTKDPRDPNRRGARAYPRRAARDGPELRISHVGASWSLPGTPATTRT